MPESKIQKLIYDYNESDNTKISGECEAITIDGHNFVIKPEGYIVLT